MSAPVFPSGPLLASIAEAKPWKIPDPCPRKPRTGESVQVKICTVYRLARAYALTANEALAVVGLIDHESAGTWSPTVRGDGGCSIGIAQWNSCVGRRAPASFEAQARLIITEMRDKFAANPLNHAICLHNSPAGRCNRDYVAKVLAAKAQFEL